MRPVDALRKLFHKICETDLISDWRGASQAKESASTPKAQRIFTREKSQLRCYAKPISDDCFEPQFLLLLQAALSDRFLVWPRPRLSDIVMVTDASVHFGIARAVNEHTIPFVICDPNSLRPLVVIGFKSRPSFTSTAQLLIEKLLIELGLQTIKFDRLNWPSEIEVLAIVQQTLADPNLRIDSVGQVQATHVPNHASFSIGQRTA